MQIQRLTVNRFKNAAQETVVFCEGVNVLCGENASGKTNLLEAIFFFAAGKSFRGCKDRDLIRFGEQSATSELVFESNGLQRTLGVTLSRTARRQITLGHVKVQKLSEYLGLFRAVIFTPDHLHLVKGSPEFRRRFLDLAICQSFPRYAVSLQEYGRLLRQKNALLKGQRIDRDLLSVYHERMAALAAVIALNRSKYLYRLEQAAGVYQNEMSGGRELLELKYVSQVHADAREQDAETLKAMFLDFFARHAEAEIGKGVPLFGPQKDDFSVLLNQKNARLFGSQGQQRSAVLSLKLAEGELSKQLTGEYPVFLLDDILSELDQSRRAYILSRIGGKQVVLTGCEPELFSAYDGANRIFVENGVAKNV